MKFAMTPSLLAIAAFAPLTAQAAMVELTDLELGAVQGKAGSITAGFGAGFREYWTELTTVQGNPTLHYVGWGLIGIGSSLMIPFQQTARLTYQIQQAPPPVNRLVPVTAPLWVVAAPPAAIAFPILIQGLYLLYANGELTIPY